MATHPIRPTRKIIMVIIMMITMIKRKMAMMKMKMKMTEINLEQQADILGQDGT